MNFHTSDTAKCYHHSMFILLKSGQNRITITIPLHEDQRPFLRASLPFTRWRLIGVKNVSNKTCIKAQDTHYTLKTTCRNTSRSNQTRPTWCTFSSCPRHKGVWGNGRIAPSILGSGTRRVRVASFKPSPFNPPGGGEDAVPMGAWVGPRARLNTVGKR